MKQEHGLTLIELVVVAFLIAILTSILYGALGGIIRTRDRTEELRSTDRTAHYLFGRIGLEIGGRSFVPLNTVTADSAGSGSTAPPSAPPLPSYIVSDNKHEGDYDSDSLRFVSANAAQAFVGSPGNFGMVEVEYRLDNSRDASPSSSGPKRILVRRETPAGISSADTLTKRTVEIPLAEDVVSLKFRFMKSGKWQDGWHETANPLPEMIEMTVSVRAPNDSVETYRTAFPISQRSPQQNRTPGGTAP